MSNYFTEEGDPAQQQQTTTPEANAGFDAWLAELQQERLDNWRREALEKHPQLQSLREYLTANTKAEVMALADDLAEKLGGDQQSTPSPSVTGGSPALSGVRHPGDTGEYSQERAMEDIRNGRDRAEVFQDRLTQKFHDVGTLAPWEQ